MPALREDTLAGSDTSDIVSPKRGPEQIMPSTSGRGIPSAAPIPINTTQIVEIVHHAVPVAIDRKTQRSRTGGKKKVGCSNSSP